MRKLSCGRVEAKMPNNGGPASVTSTHHGGATIVEKRFGIKLAIADKF